VKPTESYNLFAASDVAAPNMHIVDGWYFFRRRKPSQRARAD